jgi:potassium-transporting ATPase KdpC subunit
VTEGSNVKGHLLTATRMLAILTLLTGLAYPLAMTVLASALFPSRSQGSVIRRDGRAIGSRLIGQPFDAPRYFWGRLSATTPACNAAASNGSNLGPLHPALAVAAQTRIDALRAADPANREPVPVDLVTASASGLDPHISLAGAQFQVARVAKARGLALSEVWHLVNTHTEPRAFGVLGEPVVDVLELNLALDALPR